MAKRGGFPGGMGMPGNMNMNNLMKQAQKMQRQMEENQKALEEKEYTCLLYTSISVLRNKGYRKDHHCQDLRPGGEL